ncbi:MAG: hypothetical protein CAF45_016675 [Nitrospira sp. CG24E]|nr:MAG: hypothetical protein CAF45_016675 [Nitrospira sp. CG24E]
MPHKRVLVIANKSWEATALMNVLLEPKGCPSEFPWPIKLSHPLPPRHDWQSPQPRGVFNFQGNVQNKPYEVRVEVWCIQDAMDPSVSPSSTKEKVRVLPKIFSGMETGVPTSNRPDLVIALGTACFPGAKSYNGCVFIGTNVFIHDPYKSNTTHSEYWHSDNTNRLINPPPGSMDFFNPRNTFFDDVLRSQVETRLLSPPMKPATKPILLADNNYTAVGVANITNYDDYAWADLEALEAFKKANRGHQKKRPVGSLETTHGVIRLQSEAPFLFISGITDRLGQFSMDVGTRPYAQNFVCAHNTGIVTAWLLPRIVSFLNTL